MVSYIRLIPIFFGMAFFMAGCDGFVQKRHYKNSDMYDFSNPKLLELPQELDEISGIVYYPKDTSVFAIIDEDGILFKISLNNPRQVKSWKFDKKRDFEDLVLLDSNFYALISNGDVEKISFTGNTISTSRSNFSDYSKSANEFETLYADNDSTLVLICKTCEADDKKAIGQLAYSIADSFPYRPLPSLDMTPVNKKLGVNKYLKPSAGAINPITKDLYLVSSIQNLLVIFNSKGVFKELYKLDPGLYKQPEGLAFTPEGHLIISNEFGEEGLPTLLLMKNKKTGK